MATDEVFHKKRRGRCNKALHYTHCRLRIIFKEKMKTANAGVFHPSSGAAHKIFLGLHLRDIFWITFGIVVKIEGVLEVDCAFVIWLRACNGPVKKFCRRD